MLSFKYKKKSTLKYEFQNKKKKRFKNSYSCPLTLIMPLSLYRCAAVAHVLMADGKRSNYGFSTSTKIQTSMYNHVLISFN